MKTKLIFVALSIIIVSLGSGCTSFQAAKHNYIMRGQILESTDDGIYLCIGSADGAQEGQEYKVYKFIKISDNKSAKPNYKKKETGTIKITNIVDDHYAKAKILTGEAKENFIVELDK